MFHNIPKWLELFIHIHKHSKHIALNNQIAYMAIMARQVEVLMLMLSVCMGMEMAEAVVIEQQYNNNLIFQNGGEI